jgi:hypothetical protein
VIHVSVHTRHPGVVVYGETAGSPWVSVHLRPTWRTGRRSLMGGAMRIYELGFLRVSTFDDGEDS